MSARARLGEKLRALRAPGSLNVAEVSDAIEDGLRRYLGPRLSIAAATTVGAMALTETGAGFAWKKLVNVTKPLIVPALTVHSLQRLVGISGTDADTDKALLAASAALYTGGDIALLPDVEPIPPSRYTPGEVSFGLGHIAAGILLTRLGARSSVRTVAPAAGMAAAMFALRRATMPQSLAGDLVFGGYAALLSEYSLRSVSTLWNKNWSTTAAVLTAGGGLAWLLSDSLIAVRMMLAEQTKTRGLLSYLVMDTYGAAQLFSQAGITLQLAQRHGKAL